MRRLATWLLLGLFALMLVAAAGFVVWANTGYPASAEAEEVSERADEDEGGWYAFGAGGDPSVGIVLYPGGRVDPAAYALVAKQLSRESGALVAVTRAPLNFAIFESNAAEGVMAAHPEIERWIVGGHSLGGVAAASFAESHSRRVDGLLLWASYPSGRTDLSPSELEATSVYASRDGEPAIPRQEAQAEIIDASSALVRRIDDQEASGISKKNVKPGA